MLYSYFHHTDVKVSTNNQKQEAKCFCVYGRNFRGIPLPAPWVTLSPPLTAGLTRIPTESKNNIEVFKANRALPSSFVVQLVSWPPCKEILTTSLAIGAPDPSTSFTWRSKISTVWKERNACHLNRLIDHQAKDVGFTSDKEASAVL